jgi:serine/threonine-protein kinase
MNTANGPAGEREQRWGEIAAACLEALERGQAVDRTALAAAHPEFADDLAEFFAQYDRLEGLAGPLRAAVQGVAAAQTDPGLRDDSLGEAPGSSPDAAVRSLGDYELLEEIAHGGMGVVYKARQKTLNRVVALKMVRSGDLGPEGERRFRLEAEFIASLDHPNIVPIYEVGEVAGRHFFSMKLMEGGSLAGQQERSPADPRSAARMVATVARAVHHAHQRGILHRDLKPANIMLDRDETPHVTDFGLAKRLDVKDSLSQSGAVVGTLRYMAPEQLSGGRTALTTAADVYGLGGILYALLTARPPFDEADPVEALCKVREQMPKSPHEVNPRVDRDLATICLKCLEKEPARRYPSAEALAEDLERWLAGEPIVARPISRTERAWRWCRRNPVVAGLAAAVALLLVITIVGLSISTVLTRKAYKVADEQRRRAQQHSREARAAADKLLTQVGQERLTNIPGMELVRRELLQDALAFYQRFLEEDSTDTDMRQDVGKAYIRVAEIQGKLGRQKEEEDAFRQAEAVFHKLTDEFPDRPDYWQDLARCYEGSGWSALERPKEREQAIGHALEIREQLVQRFPQEAAYRDDLANTWRTLSNVQSRGGRREQAIETARLALGIQDQLVREDRKPLYRKHLADILTALGTRLLDESRYDEAKPLLRRSKNLQEELTHEFPNVFEYRHDLIELDVFLGDVLSQTGRFQEAVETYQEALGISERVSADFPGFPDGRGFVATLKGGNLGKLLARMGHYREAEQAYREALVIYEKLEADYPIGFQNRFSRVNQGETNAYLGELFMKLGRIEDAEKVYVRMRTICEKAAKDFDEAVNRNNLALSHAVLGDLHRIAGRLPEAEQAYHSALAVQERVIVDDPGNPMYRHTLGTIQADLGMVLWLAGRSAESEQHYRQALATFEKLVAENSEDTKYRTELAWLLATCPVVPLRDASKAVGLMSEVVKQMSQDAECWKALGVAQYRAGNFEAAAEALSKAAELHGNTNHDTWFFLAMAHARLGHETEARKWYEQAVEWTEKNQPKHDEMRRLCDEAADLLGKRKRP